MKTKNLKILIIGSEGYLGSKLSEYLLKKKYYVEGIDIGYFKNCKISKTVNYKIKKKRAQDVVENDIKKFNVVIQLAAFSNDPINTLKAKKFYKPSLKYTIKIARICKKFGVKFIFPSSCSVYGFGKKIFNEKSKVGPITHYSKNKIEIEKNLLKIQDKKFRPVILRLATVFGFSPRIRFDVVGNMFCGMSLTEKQITLNSDGSAWRPHLFIEDACSAFEYFINYENKKLKNYIFNIGKNQNNCTILDLAKKIKKKVPNCKIIFFNRKKIIEVHKDSKISKVGLDKRSYIVSFNKLKNYTKFKPIFSIEQGINSTLKELKKIKINYKKFISEKFYRLQTLKKIKNI